MIHFICDNKRCDATGEITGKYKTEPNIPVAPLGWWVIYLRRRGEKEPSFYMTAAAQTCSRGCAGEWLSQKKSQDVVHVSMARVEEPSGD